MYPSGFIANLLIAAFSAEAGPSVKVCHYHNFNWSHLGRNTRKASCYLSPVYSQPRHRMNKGNLSTKTAADILPAQAAKLRYTPDTIQGIRRRRSGRGFSYYKAGGKRIEDRQELARIKALVIPEAWKDVWICPDPNGHLQATGRDAKGRKQYIYHPGWRKMGSEIKFDRMVSFAKALKAIRGRMERDLALPGLAKEKVLATVVRLLETTLIRVGNEEYVKENRSFGLTTMRDHHLEVSGAVLRFRFRGKSGIEHTVEVDDSRVARIVKRCRDLPGHELFQYVDDTGQRHAISSEDVNAYLKEIAGEDFTAKDFRTWGGTMCAALTLVEMGPFDSQAHAKRNIADAVKKVAKHLGNKPATCRKFYVHPAIFEAYLDGILIDSLENIAQAKERHPWDLGSQEMAIVRFLEEHATSNHQSALVQKTFQ
jgi:DNA topoisomerase I